MTDVHKSEHAIKRYLLRTMSPQERAEFEDSYLADPDLFEQLAAVEDDLIRSYLRGECSSQEKEELERRLAASPDWRDKVDFERSLMEHLASSPAPADAALEAIPAVSVSAQEKIDIKLNTPRFAWPRLPALHFAEIAIVLLLLAGGAWLATANHRLRQEFAELQLREANAERHEQELLHQLEALNARSLTLTPLVLTPHLVRGGGGQEKQLVVPLDVSSVPIQLQLENDTFRNYDLILETVEGDRLWFEKSLKSQHTQAGEDMISIDLPSNVLHRGTYILKLNGTAANGKKEEVADYTFSVAKR